MRSWKPLVVALLATGLVNGGLTSGQTLLNTLEAQLRGAAGGAAPAEAASAPAPGYLGMFPDEADISGKGVRVHSVKENGPAEKSGLKANDLITAIDGKALTKLTDLDEVLGKATAGQKLRMTIERDGKVQALDVTLGTRPAAPPATGAPATNEPPTLAPPTAPTPSLTDPTPRSVPSSTSEPPPPPLPGATAPATAEPATGGIRARPLDLGQPPPEPSTTETTPIAPAESFPSLPGASGGATLGITVVPLTEEARERYRVSAARRGALITSIRPGSPADRAGLPIGGVVVSMDTRRIDTADDLVAAVRAARPGQEVELTYYEGDRLARKTVRLGPVTAGPPPAMPSIGPLGQGTGPGTGSDRPLLSRAEGLLDRFAGGVRGPSTVYNPAEMAALQARQQELAEQLRKIEERLKAIESKLGTAPASTTTAPAAGSGSGLGGLSAPGTNP